MKEGSSVISGLSVNAPMCNLRLSVNELMDKAEITHWRTDEQSGDEFPSYDSSISISTYFNKCVAIHKPHTP